MGRPLARIVCVLTLLAAGCSGDGESVDPRELDLPADTATADSTATGAPSEPATTLSTTTLRPPAPTDPPPDDPPAIGDLELPCAPGSPVELPERPGIGPEAITIGTGMDRGGLGTPEAGLGVGEMVEALADHCNASGGLAGREVRVVEYDAAAEEAVDRVEEACTEVVALVGHRFLQADEAENAAATCALVSYPASLASDAAVPFPLHGHLAAAFAEPERALRIVLVGPDTAADAAARAARRAAIEASAGVLSVVGEVAYPIDTVPSWSQVADAARATGAGQVHLEGGCTQAVVPFAAAAADTGWDPMIVVTPTGYDPACLSMAQPDRFLAELPFLPFEDGRDAPATREHAELLDLVAAPHTGNSLLAASAFWRWATAAVSCLAEDTACYSSFTDSQTDWTAGGLHAAVDPTEPAGACAVVVAIEEGAFVRRLPVEPGDYDCRAELSTLVPAAAAPTTETPG